MSMIKRLTPLALGNYRSLDCDGPSRFCHSHLCTYRGSKCKVASIPTAARAAKSGASGHTNGQQIAAEHKWDASLGQNSRVHQQAPISSNPHLHGDRKGHRPPQGRAQTPAKIGCVSDGPSNVKPLEISHCVKQGDISGLGKEDEGVRSPHIRHYER
jgi:hypothetical protein